MPFEACRTTVQNRENIEVMSGDASVTQIGEDFLSLPLDVMGLILSKVSNHDLFQVRSGRALTTF